MEEKDKIEKIAKEAKDLLALFEEYKEKAEINNKSIILKYLDRTLIAKTIVPFLDLQDIVHFSETCRDIKSSINSTVAMVSYYKALNNKVAEKDFQSLILRPTTELNDVEDVNAELENAKKVKFNFVIFFFFKMRDFFKKKLMQSEAFINTLKSDLDYLKTELNSQGEITETLTETLNNTRNELEEAKRYNLTIKSKLDEANKNFDENVKFFF